MKCVEYQADVGTNCGICIRTCPFNKSKHWGHDLVRLAVKGRVGSLDSLLVWIDDRLGYGRFKNADHFWWE
jgi:NAD-dependent dihydropyrimidine dehydrogenase PreA subunit